MPRLFFAMGLLLGASCSALGNEPETVQYPTCGVTIQQELEPHSRWMSESFNNNLPRGCIAYATTYGSGGTKQQKIFVPVLMDVLGRLPIVYLKTGFVPSTKNPPWEAELYRECEFILDKSFVLASSH